MRHPQKPLIFVAAAIAIGCGAPASSGERYFRDKPVSHWLTAAHDPNPKVRRTAIDVLGNVGPSDPAAIPAIIEALSDREPRVREAAVLSLSKIGPPAASAAPQVEALLADSDPKVREAAALAADRLHGRF